MKTLNFRSSVLPTLACLALLCLAVSLSYAKSASADETTPSEQSSQSGAQSDSSVSDVSDEDSSDTAPQPAPSDESANDSAATQDQATQDQESTAQASEGKSDAQSQSTTNAIDESQTTSSASSSDPISTLVSTTSPSAQEESVQHEASSTESGFLAPSQDATTSAQEATTTQDDTSGSASDSGYSEGGGSPSLSATTSSPTILSGSAVAIANILNFLNTNFINSSGGILVSNFVNEMPTIDLRDVSLFTGMCGPSPCSGQGGIQVNLLQDASIENNIIVSALTGRNFASGAIGQSATSAIQTGDAFAGLNLINLANANFINANYLLVTLNAFSGANGDIIFPSLQNFFSQSGGGAPLESGSSFESDATVSNDVHSAADSGGNTTEGAETSVISSGSSHAYTNVFNQINSILPDTRISILFRISGTWQGQMYGLPDYVSQVRSPDGSIFLFGASSTPSSAQPNLVNSTSTAGISNDVQVSALSGENSIENASTSLISTGNAFAGANIINIANQNIIGHNWILAIINIFGNFKGNISFGRPDLWIGDHVDAPGRIQNGSDLTYTLTVINNGDADAHEVTLTERPDLSHVKITGSSLPFDEGDGVLRWNLGTIPAGKAAEVTYTASVHSAPQGIAIVSESEVGGTPSDDNLEDNKDSITVQTSSFGGGGGGGISLGAPASASGGPVATSTKEFKISVERISAHIAASALAPLAAESLVVTNKSDFPLKSAKLHDILRDPSGDVLHDEVWDLETIAPHEQITISYDIQFSPTAKSGKYILTTDVESAGWPTASFANGSIDFTRDRADIALDLAQPQIEIGARTVSAKHAPISTVIASSSTSTQSLPKPSLSLAAAAAAGSAPAQPVAKDVGLFALLFAGSYGALRLLLAVLRAGASV